MPYQNTAHDAMVRNMIAGFSTLGAGLGQAGHYFTPEAKAERERKIAEDERKRKQAEMGAEVDTKMHPLDLSAIDEESRANEDHLRAMAGRPTSDTFDSVIGPGKTPTASPAMFGALTPKGPTPQVPPLPSLGMGPPPPPMAPPGPPPMMGGSPAPPPLWMPGGPPPLPGAPLPPPAPPPLAGGGPTTPPFNPGLPWGPIQPPPMPPPGMMPPPLPPPGVGGPPRPMGPTPAMPPGGPGAGPGAQVNPNLGRPVGAPLAQGAPMGKAPVPAIPSLPGSGDFSRTTRRSQREVHAAHLRAFTGNNPALAANLSQQGVQMALLEDPDAVARDNLRIAKATAAGPSALPAIEGQLETRAGREAFAGMTQGLAGEGRRTQAATAAATLKGTQALALDKQKHGEALELQGAKNKGAVEAAKARGGGKEAADEAFAEELAAITDAADDEEVLRNLVQTKTVQTSKGILSVLKQIKESRVGQGKLSADEGKAIDRALKMADNAAQRMANIEKAFKDAGTLPDYGTEFFDEKRLTPEQVEVLKNHRAQVDRFKQDMVKWADMAEKRMGGTVEEAPPAEAPAPGAPKAPAGLPKKEGAAPRPTLPATGEKMTPEQILNRAAAAKDAGNQEEFARLFAEYQAATQGPQSKAMTVGLPEKKPPASVEGPEKYKAGAAKSREQIKAGIAARHEKTGKDIMKRFKEKQQVPPQ